MLYIEGFIIGIGKILPGISGSVLALIMGVYEDILSRIKKFYLKDNMIYLMKMGIGFLCAVVIGSKLLSYFFCMNKLLMKYIVILFIVLEIPSIYKKGKNIIIILLSFLFCLTFLLLKNNLIIKNVTFNYFIIGVIESVSTIVPGISGTAIFMLLGNYQNVLDLYSTIYLIDMKILLPFILGLIITSIIVIKIMNYLLDKYERETFSMILGFILASIFTI